MNTPAQRTQRTRHLHNAIALLEAGDTLAAKGAIHEALGSESTARPLSSIGWGAAGGQDPRSGGVAPPPTLRGLMPRKPRRRTPGRPVMPPRTPGPTPGRPVQAGASRMLRALGR